MQKDEDVGKVSQATPFLICKSIVNAAVLAMTAMAPMSRRVSLIIFLPFTDSFPFLSFSMRCNEMKCIAKVLELFMQDLIDASCVYTRKAKDKRLLNKHM